MRTKPPYTAFWIERSIGWWRSTATNAKGIAILLGVLTWFGLPLVTPSLSSVEWLSTIIVTEAYLSFIAGHLIAFGGLRKMQERLQLGRTSWRNIGLTFLLWLAVWAAFIAIYLALGSYTGVVSEMGKAVLKIGSLYGRLNGAGPALIALGLIQPILITPPAEELLLRHSRRARWPAGP